MVDGYDSTRTLSEALKYVLWISVLVGVGMIGTGGLAAVSSSSSVEDAQRYLVAIRTGPSILFLFTGLLCVAWMVRSRSNVRHLGKSKRIGVWKRIKAHLVAFVGAVLLTIGAFIVPDLGPLLVLLALVLILYSSMWFQFLMLDSVRMLWRTSASGQELGQEEDVAHFVLIWFWAWITFAFALGVGDVPALAVPTRGLVSIIGGIALIVAAILAARVVVEISRRQDARLEAIMNNVDDDKAVSVAPVTTSQIQSAWLDSESLIELPNR